MLSGEMAERTEPQAILVVEDDVPLLQAVERTFREAGRTVVACSTFEEGRKALRTHRFAGLLTVGRCACVRTSFPSKAGDRIRTGDVQLGKLAFYR